MQAYTYVEKGKFALLEKPKPVLLHERDAIVKVTLASICSSDLHIKHGSVPSCVFQGIFYEGLVGQCLQCCTGFGNQDKDGMCYVNTLSLIHISPYCSGDA